MVSGGHISKELRCNILHQILVLQHNAVDAYANTFIGRDVDYTLESFKKLYRTVKKMTKEQVERYKEGPIPMTLTGRKRKYGVEVSPRCCRYLVHTLKISRYHQKQQSVGW